MTLGPLLRKKLGLLNNERAAALYRIGITPMRSTMVSIFFKFLTLYFLFIDNLIFAGLALLLDYFFDMLDGMIARAVHKETKLGSYLDKSFDYIARRGGYFLLAYNGYVSYETVMIVVATVFLTPFALYYIDRFGMKTPELIPSWGDPFLIFFVFFTGMVSFFLNMIILVNIALFAMNMSAVIYLNIKR